MLLRSLAFVTVASMLAFAPGLNAQETPRMGGVLKVAAIGEPPTLDIPNSTAVLTYEIMWHVNESLFTYDKAWTPVPLLAESHAVGDKGLRHTITLRKGVKFHNGKEMTAADVVPSIQRWGQVNSTGKLLWKTVESIEAKDSTTVVIHLKQPSASLLYGLSEPGAAIYPKEVIEAAGDGTLKEFIGTGPYRFVEHRADRHIKLARFKDYAARAEPPAASAASAPPISTRSSSSPSPTPRCGWRAWRPASITTPCSSSRTPGIASSPCPRSSRAS